jgi:hypothetical protein
MSLLRAMCCLFGGRCAGEEPKPTKESMRTATTGSQPASKAVLPSGLLSLVAVSQLLHTIPRPVSASHIFHPQRDIHRLATAACRWPQRSSHGSRGHRQSRSLSSRIAPPDMTRPRRHLLLSSEWERPSRTKFASESCRANLIAFQKSGFEESKRP